MNKKFLVFVGVFVALLALTAWSLLEKRKEQGERAPAENESKGASENQIPAAPITPEQAALPPMNMQQAPTNVEAMESVVGSAPAPASEEVVVEITAQDDYFTPRSFTLRKGMKAKLNVRLYAINQNASFTFTLPDFSVSEKLIHGEAVSVSLTADKTGTFPYILTGTTSEGSTTAEGRLNIVE